LLEEGLLGAPLLGQGREGLDMLSQGQID
jgi:hypothetical protein